MILYGNSLKDSSLYLLTASTQDFYQLSSGIQQGSILESLLFTDKQSPICYLSSFAHAFLFADGTKCYKRIKDTVDMLHFQEDIDSRVLHRDKLLLNFSKCVYSQLNSGHHPS